MTPRYRVTLRLRDFFNPPPLPTHTHVKKDWGNVTLDSLPKILRDAFTDYINVKRSEEDLNHHSHDMQSTNLLRFGVS